MVREILDGHEKAGMVRANLEEARVEPTAMVMVMRRLEWFGHVKRRDETENIRAVAGVEVE